MRKAFLILLFSQSLFGWTLVGENIQGWAGNRITFGVNTANCPLSDAEYLAIVDQAIALWNSVPTAKVRIQRAESTTSVATFLAYGATDPPVILCDPDIGTNLSVDEDLILGVATRLVGSPALNYGGVLINASGEDADISNSSTLQASITLAHEIGHVLGLGHSQVTQSLMYFSVTGKTELLLSQDDQDGFTFLYTGDQLAQHPFGCAAVRSNRASSPAMLWLFALWFFGIIVAVRKTLLRTQ